MTTTSLLQEIKRLPIEQQFFIMEQTLQSIKRHETKRHSAQSPFREAFGALETTETAEELIAAIRSSCVAVRQIEEL